MSIEKVRAQIKGGVWQGMAQSGLDLSALPGDAQDKLVDAITMSVLRSVNEVMDEASKAQPAPELDNEERVLWEGRPYLSMVEFYTVTTERVKITRGMFGKDTENFELVRVQDIDVSQSASERMFHVGDITIRGADPSSPVVVLRNVTAPQDVYEMLRKAWLAARKKYGLQFREQM